MQKQQRATRSRTSSTRSASFEAGLKSRVQVWLLRGLLQFDLVLRVVPPVDYDDDEELDLEADVRREIKTVVAQFLGLETCVLREAPRRQLRRLLRAHLKTLCARRRPPLVAVSQFARELSLSPLETDLLLFGIAVKRRGPVREGVSYFGPIVERAAVVGALAVCLSSTPEEVGRALSARGTLALTGLMSLEEDDGPDLDDWIKVLPGLGARFSDPEFSVASLLASYLRSGTEGARDLGDFAYLGEPLEATQRILAGAVSGAARGINILIYGPPGTGKTALVRALNASLGTRLLEVAVSTSEGETLAREGRTQALRLVGHLGAQSGASLILFDEVEDYFGQEWGFDDDEPGPRAPKGFTVELLENAAAPTIWVTNGIERIDPALRRRFCHILELGPPPVAVRARMAAQHLAPLGLDQHPLKARIAAQERLAPGLIARAAESTLLCGDLGEADRARIFEQVLNGHLQALRRPALRTLAAADVPYQLEQINVDLDVALLVQRLRVHPSGRLLFVGAPGTGKTELARYLAAALERPCQAVKASDLLGSYVGESERRIAATFAQARAQNALLVMDECDSFLASRAWAQHSWEVTLVNEMLTQIETFEGILVATTNTQQALDPAAFRRFDLKLRFGPLKLPQALALWRSVLVQAAIPTGAEEEARAETELSRLPQLTAGDFAAAVRGLRLRGEPLSPEALLRALARECLPKPESRSIGFTASPMAPARAYND